MDHRKGETNEMGENGKTKGLMRMAIILALAVLFFVGTPEWLAVLSWKSSALHHFFHANIFHLLVNCWSCWILFRPEGRNNSLLVLFVGYVIATLSYGMAMPLLSRAPIGFSNILMAVCGLSVRHYAPGWWKRSWFLTMIGVNLLMLVTPAVAALTHLLSFVLGLAVGQASRIVKQNARDYERVTGHR